MALNTPFDSATVTRFKNNGEDDFEVSRPCILDRVSIALVTGTDVYSLPSYCINIKRVTYLGWQVYPLPHRDLRASYISGTQQSRPYWYIFNNIGQGQIKLFPVPAADLAQVLSPWTQPDILNGFVIEFYRTPDYNTFITPSWFRNRIRDNYANYRCFMMEGRWQNMKAAKYFKVKWSMLKDLFIEQLDDLQNKPRNIVASGNAQRPYGFIPPPPMLPINKFGIGVDDITG
jgi:hypothetical protein